MNTTELKPCGLRDFVEGYLRPMVKHHERQVGKLRVELDRATTDLTATRRVIELLGKPEAASLRSQDKVK